MQVIFIEPQTRQFLCAQALVVALPPLRPQLRAGHGCPNTAHEQLLIVYLLASRDGGRTRGSVAALERLRGRGERRFPALV